MSQPRGSYTDEQMEQTIGNLLRMGGRHSCGDGVCGRDIVFNLLWYYFSRLPCIPWRAVGFT